MKHSLLFKIIRLKNVYAKMSMLSIQYNFKGNMFELTMYSHQSHYSGSFPVCL
jgi:hypothetical protein